MNRLARPSPVPREGRSLGGVVSSRQRGRGRPRPDRSAVIGNVQTPLAQAGIPAPQCGTGVLARQISENRLEIGQTSAVRSEIGIYRRPPQRDLVFLMG